MVSQPPRDFSALIALVAQAKDRAAFAEIFGYYGPRIKALLIKSGSAPAMAEELAHW